MNSQTNLLLRTLSITVSALFTGQIMPVLAQPYVTPGSDKDLMRLIQTRIISNDGSRASDYAIRVGNDVYPAFTPTDGSANGFQILVLDRGTLQVVTNESAVNRGPQDLHELQYQLSNYADCTQGQFGCILVVQSLRNVGWTPRCDTQGANCNPGNITPGYILSLYGGTKRIDYVDGRNPNTGYSLIASTTTSTSFSPPTGPGYERLTCNQSSACSNNLDIITAGGGASISGVLIRDNNQAYSFAYPGRASFSTGTRQSETSNTVTISGHPNRGAYQSAQIPAGQGAFHVVVVYRDSLQLVYNNTFHYTELYNSDPTVWTMQRALFDVYNHGNYLVFVSLIGGSWHDTWKAEWSQVGLALSNLGATYSVFQNIGATDDYSFVGSRGATLDAGAIEASSVISTQIRAYRVPSNQQGVLTQDRYGNYSPIMANLMRYDSKNNQPINSFDPQSRLDAIALRAPTVWPATNTDGQKAACAYLSSCALDSATGCSGSTDMRAAYTNTLFVTNNAREGLARAVLTPNSNFTQNDLDTVRTQLNLELDYLDSVRGLLTNITNLYNAIQQDNTGAIKPAYDAVTKALSPPAKAQVSSGWKAVIAGAQTIASDVASIAGGPPAKLALDLVWVSSNIASAFANDATGNPLENATVTFDALEDQAVSEYGKHLTVIGNLFDLIVSDWGRLQALGAPLKTGTIKWDDSFTGTVTSAMLVSLKRQYLVQLIDASFEFGIWFNMGQGAPPELKSLCEDYTGYYTSFGGPDQQWVCDTPDSDDQNWITLPRQPVTGSGSNNGDGQSYDIYLFGTDVRCSAEKNSSLLAPLFASLTIGNSDNLGLYKTYFFLNANGRRRLYTDAECNK